MTPEAADNMRPPSYATRPIKRARATQPEMAERRAAILEIARENQPCSVRHIYYRATVTKVVAKDDSGYSKVQRDVLQMRRAGLLPYAWIVDSVRWRREPETYNDLADAIYQTARVYRRALWSSSPVVVEVWCESNSIAGVLNDVVDKWAVPLIPLVGFSSETFAVASALELNARRRPAVIYYVGDFDPYGLLIEQKVRETLADWAEVPFTFTRLGVTWEQVQAWDLPGTKPKRAFGYPIAVEAEAIPANMIRAIVSEAIEQHVDPHALAVLQVAEASEREQLFRMAAASRAAS